MKEGNSAQTTKARYPPMDKDEVLKWLEKRGTQRTVEGMARYGIRAQHAFGVPMGTLLTLAKRLGKDHDLATELWESGWYEARLLATLIGDPQHVTRRQMNAWAASFENWADCDTVCFKLWDRTPLAWEKASQWAGSPREFVKRAAFALMACLALHDKAAPDKNFLALLPPHREGRARRTQLREEGRELGAPFNRQAQFGAQLRRCGGGQAPGVVGGSSTPMGRQRRATRAGESESALAAGSPEDRREERWTHKAIGRSAMTNIVCARKRSESKSVARFRTGGFSYAPNDIAGSITRTRGG